MGTSFMKEGHQEKPFQHLLFLVRDWSNIDEGYGFEKGEIQLEQLLEKKSGDKSIDSVRENLKRSFEHLRCFLMNEPGVNVRKRGQDSPPLQIKDLGDDFRKDAVDLVKGIFSPENLVIKKMNGKVCNGKDVLDLSKAYSKIFQQGKLPKLETIAEAQAKAMIEIILREGEDIYKEDMTKMQKSGYAETIKLQEKHDETREEIMSWFDAQPKLGSDEFARKKKKHLTRLLEKWFVEFKERNEEEKERQQEKITHWQYQVLSQYRKGIEEKIDGKYVEDDLLTTYLKDCESKARDEFSKKTVAYPSKLVEHTEQQLQEDLKYKKESIRKTNDERKEAATNKLKQLRMEAKEQYQRKILKSTKGDEYPNLEQLEEKHEKQKSKAMAIYSSFQDGPQAVCEHLKEQLQKEIRTTFEDVKRRNKEQQTRKTEDIRKDTISRYKKKLEERFSLRKYIEEKELCRVLLKFKTETIEEFTQNTKIFLPELVVQSRQLLDDDLDQENKAMDKQNSNWKKAATAEIIQRKKQALKDYKHNIEKIVYECQTEGKLDQKHKEYKTEATRFYAALQDGPQDVLTREEEELQNEIEGALKELKLRQKTRQEKGLRDRRKEVLSKFKRNVEKECNGKYVDDAFLNKILQDGELAGIEDFEQQKRNVWSELFEQQHQQLKGDLKKAKESFQKLNNERKEAAIAKSAKMKLEAKTEYEDRMEKSVQENKHLDQNQIEALHAKYKSIALEKHESYKDVPQQTLLQNKEQLKEELESIFERIKVELMVLKNNSMSDSRALQLCKTTSTGELELDINVLMKVLEPIRNMPVAIYSIAGVFRSGKSFLLNLFVRYLRMKSKGEEKDWLENKDDEIGLAFHWRPGQDRCTTGIWIWNEPFYLESASKKETVAVFLMDTQGAFDSQTNTKEFSALFALSTFLSSVQIYNVFRQIQEDSLQQLELFTNYANHAGDVSHQKAGTASDSVSRSSAQFQKLLFLVRDSQHVDDGYGFQAGIKKLLKVLKKKKNHEELDSLRKNLKRSFDDIDCFVMHQPGEEVAFRSKNAVTLRVKDLGEKFARDLNDLVKGLFGSKEIIKKKVNGKVINGGDLIRLTLEYFEVFKEGKMPELRSLAEANAKVAIESIFRKCRKKYREKMIKVLDSGYANHKTLDENHNQNKAEVLKWFDCQPKMGSDDFAQRSRKEAEKEMNYQFMEFSQRNKAKEEQLKNEIQKKKNQVESNFRRKVETWYNRQYREKRELTAALQDCISKALDEFTECTKEFVTELVEQPRQQLEESLEKEKQWFENLHDERLEAVRNKIVAKKIQVLTHYKGEINQCVEETECQDEEELQEKHEEYKSNAMTMYELCREEPDAIFQQEKEKLKSEIESFFDRAKHQNEENVNQKLRTILEEAKAEHWISMNMLCDEAIFPVWNLKQHYETLLKKILDEVPEQIRGQNNQSRLKELIEAALNSQQDIVAKRQKIRKYSLATTAATSAVSSAAVGAAIGSALGPVGAGIGIVAGAVIGAGIGVATAVKMQRKSTE